MPRAKPSRPGIYNERGMVWHLARREMQFDGKRGVTECQRALGKMATWSPEVLIPKRRRLCRQCGRV